jgi:hypothetical protein
MSFFDQHWLSLSGLLFALSGFGWLVWSVINGRMKNGAKDMRKSVTLTTNAVERLAPAGKTTATIAKALGLLLAVAIGFGNGYEMRGAQAAREEAQRLRELEEHRHTLTDVLILNQNSDGSYRMQTSDGQAFDAHFCKDSVVDFQPGERLRILSYQQQNGCKSISGSNLGFVAYTMNGKRVKYSITTEEIAHVQ